ncbi:MAG: hypothetical protein KBF88_11325 [Polyangiaceae bacterium]|nr:hypothetical protein [Polyangiaceae bacterium]
MRTTATSFALISSLFAAACFSVVESGGTPTTLDRPDAVPDYSWERDSSTSDPPRSARPIGPYDKDVLSTDVSILYPLPTARPEELVPARAGGKLGELLPFWYFQSTFLATDKSDTLGPVTPELAVRSAVAYDLLRLVGIRLDPCTERLRTERQDCGAEVRLVFQSIVAKGGGVLAEDDAVHAFYDLPADELTDMLRETLALKKLYGAANDPNKPSLGIHPILETQGLTGPFAMGLRAIVLEHLGAARLRVLATLRRVEDSDPRWVFREFRVVQGRFAQALAWSEIEGGSFFLESVKGSATDAPLRGSHATMSSEGLVSSLAPLAGQARQKSGDVVSKITTDAFELAVGLQDPEIIGSANRHSGLGACASCHLAEGVVSMARLEYGLLPKVSANLSSYNRTYVRQNEALNNLHAFGYLGRHVSVMQRTANESALVAAKMEYFLRSLM